MYNFTAFNRSSLEYTDTLPSHVVQLFVRTPFRPGFVISSGNFSLRYTEVPSVVPCLREMKLTKVAQRVWDSIAETLKYMCFPREHWKKIRDNNVTERLN